MHATEIRRRAVSSLVLGALLIAACLLSLSDGRADASIAGRYAVRGTNPDGSPYDGIVTIRLNGETYRMVWEIGSNRFEGTALASGDVVAAGFSGGEQNVVLYRRASDGRWIGVWTVGGSDRVGEEVLTPQ